MAKSSNFAVLQTKHRYRMKYISILLAIVCMVITGGCSNKSPETMTAKEWLGLEGKVKNIVTEREVTVPGSKSFFGQTENMITFSHEGNITYINNYITELSEDGTTILQPYDGGNGTTPESISYTKGTYGTNSITIESCIDGDDEDSPVKFQTELNFDERNRLTGIYDDGLLADILRIEGQMESLEIEFEYNRKEPFPSKASFNFNDSHSITVSYTYLETDSIGNWTQRQANDSESGELLFYEYREIEYYK